MNPAHSIQLKLYSNRYADVLHAFKLPYEQERFTALPNRFSEVAEGEHRVVIVSDDVPVGFFLLHETDRVKEFSTNPHAMLLTALSINHPEQGKGYARQGMLLLESFVREKFPECNEIVLAVNHTNIAAQKLYVKAGFHDTGKRILGPIGEQYLMKKYLDT
ncbi:GNAT family N-acetyltransferase [Halobacillus sp. A1]|uniref:GNAT family N-acetyltransferase n=1 Tax=Halobacillus sp. A1 TaxID=2880262 RepID=UPI0020A6762B|nr:GNAT family N-acetyltransferase [Halobacillus sp. A1]MCP3032288.1 GNAT family N-acetyltransferase [Halobacillus sp. A1]